MSIEKAITYSKTIEGLLENKFGANGRGLHEKLSSIEGVISQRLAGQIRYIATIRNKVVHESGYTIDGLDKFEAACQRVVDELNALPVFGQKGAASNYNSSGTSKVSSISHRPIDSTSSPHDSTWTGVFMELIPLILGLAFALSVAFEDNKPWPASIWGWLMLALQFTLVIAMFTGPFLFAGKYPALSLFASILIGTYLIDIIPPVDSPRFSPTFRSPFWYGYALIAVTVLWSATKLAFNLICFRKSHFSANQGQVIEPSYPAVSTKVESEKDNSEDFPSLARLIRKPEYAFKDVYGMEGLKDLLRQACNKHTTERKNGILLSGDPGNGKTFIAEALAGELRWNFLPISIADIESRWVGQSTEQLKAVFDVAVKHAPVVLYFDECDSILRDRAQMMGGTNDESLKKANAFLSLVADIRRRNDVLVVAATNYPEQLDTAAMRNGRFDFKIHIPNPDYDARHGLLTKFAKGASFNNDVLGRLIKRWEGFSVVRMRSIGEKIAELSKTQGWSKVGVKEAMKALRVVQSATGTVIPEGALTLDQMHFDEAERKKLMALARRMENIEEVERMGGQVPKGILFYGPPGTGKTAVAKALAKTSGWAFLATTGSDLLADNGQGIDKLIRQASDARPCIVFIDEAEEALGDRSTSRYGSTVVNKILAATDGTRPLHDVMFIAATNHPDALDAAIVRGGRFSEHFEFKRPEEDTVLAIVREWINSKKASTPFHDEFTPEVVACHLSGLAQADIKDRLQQAVNFGVGRILSGEGLEKIVLADLHAIH